MKRILLASLLLGAAPCVADSPLPAPALQIQTSNNRRFFARTNPKTRTTTVYRAASGGRAPQKLWQMPGWFRDGHLCNDGAHYVAGYNGYNLLARGDAKPSTVMLRFYRRGRRLRRVTLGELGLSTRNMERTASHWAWGTAEGFFGNDRFRVSTIDKRRLMFDARTGKIVARQVL